MWLEAIPESESDTEKCPCCGGGVRRRVFGEMYAGSYVHDGERVEIRRKPDEGFSDPVWLDPITVYFDGGLYRRWKSDRYWSRGGKKLHRDVWSLAFGQIPIGCHIHHKDGNPDNNLLANLECIPASEHLSETWRSSKSRLPASQHFSETARQKSAEWHRSEEGRLWHRRHAVRSRGWTKWKREPRNCPKCGTEFECLIRKGNAQIYCSHVCKVAAYRERKMGNVWAKNYRDRQKAKRIG